MPPQSTQKGGAGGPAKGGPARAAVASGGGPSGASKSSEKKKVRGVLGPVDRAVDKAAGGVQGALMNLLGAPQQVLFKGIQGFGDAIRGDYDHASKGLFGALGEIPTLGQAGGDIEFDEALGSIDPETGERKAMKLPRGVNTAANIGLDPLNYVTFGQGATARAGMKAAERALAEDAVQRLTSQGLKKGLTSSEKATLRETLVANAAEDGAKNPAKTADRTLKQLQVRGRGGVTVRIPGTRIAATPLSGEAAAKAPGAAALRAGRDAVKTSAPGKFVRRGLIPGASVADDHGARASEELLDALDARGARETNRVDDLLTRRNAAVRDFEKNAPKGVKFGPEQDRLVSRALQSGDIEAAKAANPELARIIDTDVALRKETLEAGQEAGTLADDLVDQERYLHRTRNPEVVKALGDAETPTLYEGRGLSKSMSPGSAKARTIAPDSADYEINEAINMLRRGETVPPELISPEDLPAVEAIARKMDAAKLPLDTPYYRESATASIVEAGVEGARAVETARMVEGLRGIKSENGVSILHNPEDLKALGVEPTKESLKAAGLVEFELPKLGKFYASPAVKNEMTKFSAIMEDDVVGAARKAINTWDRWWRGQVTASLPGGIPFASRNARTNVMLTVLDGMNPRYFFEGGRFQMRVRSVIKKHAAEIADNGVEVTMKAHLGERDFKIWKAARENGVIGDGFYNIDLSEAPEIRAAGMPKSGSKARRAVRFAAGSKGTLAVKGRAFNSAVEQHARMSHFLYGVDRFGDLGEAAARTNTVLFNYGRVTPFEQKIVKKIMPFWTFMRKNLPGQVRAFVENPIRVAMPEKLSQVTSRPVDEDAPEYQRRRGDRVQMFGPLAGLVTTPERPLQAAASSIEPIAQLAAAAIPGDQGAIEPEGGIPQGLRSLMSQWGGGPASAAKAAIDEASGTSSFTGFRLNEEERRQRLLKAAIPQLGRGPTLLAGRLPSSVAEQRTKDKAKMRTIAQIADALGIKVEFPAD